jgi:hypothetical protein
LRSQATVGAIDTSIHARTLRKAAELAGGERRLAAYLSVPEPELHAWLHDDRAPPERVFEDAVDLVLDDLDRGAFG